jgi:S-formylglutathione hydrolase FrmB
MPDTDGGMQYGLQCLNNPGGIQDMTFVARDVPDAIARIARVQPPGLAWGLAGYSEGGYCTANIALQDPQGWGAAGVMSGYFSPIASQVPAGNKPGAKPVVVNVFRGHPGLLLLNSPQEYITRMPINNELPAFWLAAGAQDRSDVAAAADFRQLLETRLANVPFVVVPGGHQGSVWRAALIPMLNWMTPQLSAHAAKADANAARAAAARAAAARAAAARKAHPAPPHPAPPHPARSHTATKKP